MAKDKVTLTLTFEREANGSVTRKADLDGEGFHFFELIGLIQMTSYDFAEKSKQTAIELPKDHKVKMKFESDAIQNK